MEHDQIILTHDIDAIRKDKPSWSYFPKIEQLKGRLGKNLYNNLEDIIALEEKYGYRSTIFIPVFLFEVDDILEILLQAELRGWEIGLHYVYQGHRQDPVGLFHTQKGYIDGLFQSFRDEEIKGVRSHHLVLREWIIEEMEKTFVYDSSTRDYSFRGIHKIRGELYEIPITIMDADYVYAGENTFWMYLYKLYKNRKNLNDFCVLFHNQSYRMKGGRLYKELLAHMANDGVYGVSCIEALRRKKLI